MSQENVELVRRTFTELGPSVTWVERAARAGLVAPDAEFDFSALYPDGPTVHGVEGWRGYVGALPWGRSLNLDPEHFFDVDDERVLVFVRATAEGKGSGVPVEMQTAHEFTIREGVIVRMKVHPDRAKALEAAGLSE